MVDQQGTCRLDPIYGITATTEEVYAEGFRQKCAACGVDPMTLIRKSMPKAKRELRESIADPVTGIPRGPTATGSAAINPR